MPSAGKASRNSTNRLGKKDRAKVIQRMLDERYPDPAPPLVSNNEFELLIAVLLSAQATDVQVNKITPALFARANSAEKMAKLQTEEILGHIRSINYSPTKAKNIKALAEKLVREHRGEVPRTLEELEELPGVGHKTASVVMSHAFGEPAFPVDTHIHRLAKRWKLSSGKNVETTEKDLKTLFAEPTWGKLHLQIIYYGREHCTARGCDGKSCPICKTLNDG